MNDPLPIPPAAKLKGFTADVVFIDEIPLRPKPIALRPAAERHAHVAARMLERGQLAHTVEQVAALEAKIKFVRTQLGQGKPVAPILPGKIGEDKERQVQFWRVKIAGAWHTFVWSLIAKGILTYVGPGELANGTGLPPKVKPAARKEDAP